MGIVFPFGCEKERARLRRESSLKHSPSYMADVYRNGSLYKDYSLQDKYIPYRLRFLHPKEDSELYFILENMLRIPWEPDDYQVMVEETMLASIYEVHDTFTGRDNAGTLEVTYGDILIYFAEYISYHAEMSVATACELLLKNLGIIQPVDNVEDIKDACYAFGKSDEYPDGITMFDPDYYSWESSFYNSTTKSYCVPSWLEQSEYYLGILVPAY